VAGIPALESSARARIGYLPERPYFHEHLTGEGLLRYFGRLSGMPSDLIEKRISEVLELVNMNHARRRVLRAYSKGMLQRIGIAQAILHSPELLILDEPMSGLDPVGRKEMRELILRLSSEEKTIFFSTHVIPDVEAICDEVAVIEKGRIVKRGTVSGFLGEEEPRVEIGFTALSPDRVPAGIGIESMRKSPDGVRASLAPGTDLNLALSRLMQNGALLISVTPIRPSLESFFEGRES
jgi:ABC-2 type transport system ATP-binding protein